MRRRNFLALVGGAALCGSARAQAPRAPRRIGFLTIGQKPDEGAPGPSAFLNDLAKFGYTRGQNLAIEYRYAEWNFDRLPGLAAELVDLHVDIIVAASTPPALAAKAATSTIPIVAQAMGDPVQDGLVASLASPGGNVTGNTFLGPELVAKRWHLLKEARATVRDCRPDDGSGASGGLLAKTPVSASRGLAHSAGSR
jgi:putative tryptophan/tyrosine transport system substrate-binding protein